jgi:GNAT superfamily N-acetyltransferase
VLSDAVREYAETPDRYATIVEGSSVSRFDDGRVCVVQGTTWGSVTGVHVSENEVGDLVTQVRELTGAGKRCTWWLGPSVTPRDLPAFLKEHGLVDPVDGVPLVKALALVETPAEAQRGIEVHRVETYEDFLAARDVQWDAFEVPEDRRERQRHHLRDEFDESMTLGMPVGFLATLDGKPAATGTAVPSDRGVFLIAGSTVPRARGRGLYRALVRARWDYAVERGTPALVTQSVPDTSYPILKKLGFVDVCDVQRVEDTY